MDTLFARLKDPSTYRGLALVLAAFGVTGFDSYIQAGSGVIVALIGVYDVIRNGRTTA